MNRHILKYLVWMPREATDSTFVCFERALLRVSAVRGRMSICAYWLYPHYVRAID